MAHYLEFHKVGSRKDEKEMETGRGKTVPVAKKRKVLERWLNNLLTLSLLIDSLLFLNSCVLSMCI